MLDPTKERCIYREKSSTYRIWYYLQFQASTGGLGRIPRGWGRNPVCTNQYSDEDLRETLRTSLEFSVQFSPLQYSALQNLASLARHILNSVASTEFPPRSCTVASKFFSDIIARAVRGLTWLVFHPVGITVLPVVQCLNIVVPYSLPIFKAGE